MQRKQQVAVRAYGVRIELDRAPQARFRLLAAPERLQRDAYAGMRAREPRLDRERFPIRLVRLVELHTVKQQFAEVRVPVRVSIVNRQRLANCFDCEIDLARLAAYVAAIVERRRKRGIEL